LAIDRSVTRVAGEGRRASLGREVSDLDEHVCKNKRCRNNSPGGASDTERLVAPAVLSPVSCWRLSIATALYDYSPFSSRAATILPRPKSEGRKSIAQCASTGNRPRDALARNGA